MKTLSLNGEWKCELPDGRRFTADVPGCFEVYIDEKDVGGAVIYERSFVYDVMDGMRYFLRFGAVSYYCDVYVNGMLAGGHEGMWDPFLIDVSDSLRSGSNLLRLEVTKPGYYDTDPFPLRRVLSGFIPDVLCTFGGPWGDVTLEEHKEIVPECHNADGDSDGGFAITLYIKTLGDESGLCVDTEITGPGGAEVYKCNRFEMEAGRIRVAGRIPAPRLWSEESPELYHYCCTLRQGKEEIKLEGDFGFRTVSARGRTMLLNGAPLYLRGLLHWGFYEQNLIPKPDKAAISNEIGMARSYGFNSIKHCLYIPSDEYLDIADQSGMLLWVELPLWLPEASKELPERIRREYPRLLRMLAGHPSVILISLGCELDEVIQAELLEEMYVLAKKETSALVRDNSGSGECYCGQAVDFADFFDYHFYGDLHNMENLMENFTPGWRNVKPWLFGEFCDSDTLRYMPEVRRSSGGEPFFWESSDPRINPLNILKPDFRLCEHDDRWSGICADVSGSRLRKLSINHSLTHRKMTLEMTRAFPEISGYNVTTFRDTPICASGMFDDAGQPKYDVGVFRSVNGAVALLPAWDLSRIWINADRVFNRERFNYYGGSQYALHVLLSNYGGSDTGQVRIEWRLRDGRQTVGSGASAAGGVPNGQVAEVSYLRFMLPEVNAPETLVLEVKALFDDGYAHNEWPVFVYPESPACSKKIGSYDPAGVFATLEKRNEVSEVQTGAPVAPELDIVITSLLTAEILRYAEKGGRVFLVQRGKGALPTIPVAFWRESMICRDYPSFWNQLHYEHYADDLRFFGVGTDTAFDPTGIQKMGFDEYRPMVRRIDCREYLASDYMCEMKYKKGKIIATTLRLEGGMGKQPLFIENNCFTGWILDQCLNALST